MKSQKCYAIIKQTGIIGEFDLVTYSKIETEATDGDEIIVFNKCSNWPGKPLVTVKKSKTPSPLRRKEEKVKKKVDETMGGKVLQLESERLREEGMVIGEARGKAIGKAIGKAEGEAIGEARMRMLINRLIADGRMEEIGKLIDSAEACRELYKEYGL